MIPKVIDNENLKILDFLDDKKYDFCFYDLEYAVLSNKLDSFKHLIKLTDGEYNLELSWSFAIAVENKKYSFVDFLLNNSDLRSIKPDAGRSEVNEASFRLGKAFNIDMVNYLIKFNCFDPIACIIGALVNKDIKSVYLIKDIYGINNQYIVQNLENHPISECVNFKPVDIFMLLF